MDRQMNFPDGYNFNKFEISNQTAMGRGVFCQKMNEIAICPHV
jgi:hypothetical protein